MVSGRRLTQDEFIGKCIEMHKNKYDYSEVVYKRLKDKISIVCPIHGLFEQTADSHKQGKGCIKCSGKYKLSKNEFVGKATEIHNNLYDYKRVAYVNMSTPVEIVCKKHGAFWMTPRQHLNSGTCRKCCGLEIDTEIFIERANRIHNDRYLYTDARYRSAHHKVSIICKEHGRFTQRAFAHLSGQGCPICRYKTPKIGGRLSRQTILRRFKNQHGNYYDYSKMKYTTIFDPIEIICPIHGLFRQRPAEHIKGSGCQSCSLGNRSKMEEEWLDSLSISVRNTQLRYDDGTYFVADGYDPETNTVYEFWGDYWHGNPDKFSLSSINKHNKKTFGELYEETQRKKTKIISSGYNLIDIWEKDWITENIQTSSVL